jgi:ABC-type amino acid transport system permease subunit
MMINVLLYTLAIFAALAVISMIVAAIMGIIFAIVNRKKKAKAVAMPVSEQQ